MFDRLFTGSSNSFYYPCDTGYRSVNIFYFTPVGPWLFRTSFALQVQIKKTETESAAIQECEFILLL